MSLAQTKTLGLKISVLSLFFILLNSSCQPNKKLPIIEPDLNHPEQQLGVSSFYLKLPPGFRLEEATGKEGQLGYDIIPLDSASTLFGSVEIQQGRPIGGANLYDNPKRYARSLFLGKETIWKMEQTETGYFVAYTRKEGISAEASSKNKKGLDSLISIIATLRKK
jgi:hypothetical protein